MGEQFLRRVVAMVEQFPFVAEYAAGHPGGAAWIDVFGGYADGMASTWRHVVEADLIEARFATAEQRERFAKRILALEHVRPLRLYDKEG